MKSPSAATAAPFAGTLFVAFVANWIYRTFMAKQYGSVTYLYDPDVGHLVGNWPLLQAGTAVMSALIFVSSLAGARLARPSTSVPKFVMIVLAIVYGIAFWAANNPLWSDTALLIYGLSLVVVGPFVITYVAATFWRTSRNAV